MAQQVGRCHHERDSRAIAGRPSGGANAAGIGVKCGHPRHRAADFRIAKSGKSM